MKAFPSRPRAFTLVELLVVMGIILLLAAIVVPAAGPMLRGSQLTQGSAMLVDQFNLARQQALAMNCPVEVRLYQFSDPSLPGQTVANPGSGKYRAMQAFAISGTGAAVALGKLQLLPGTVIMDSGDKLSTIISGAGASGWVKTGSSLNTSLPRVGTSYNCVAFRYMPDGSTNLPQTAPLWYLTLHGLEAGDGMSTPPPNFFTVQISATNGHLQSYRP